MIATVTTSCFLLTADYGPQPNAHDPIKNAILSAQRAAEELIFGSKKKDADSDRSNAGSKEKV